METQIEEEKTTAQFGEFTNYPPLQLPQKPKRRWLDTILILFIGIVIGAIANSFYSANFKYQAVVSDHKRIVQNLCWISIGVGKDTPQQFEIPVSSELSKKELDALPSCRTEQMIKMRKIEERQNK